MADTKDRVTYTFKEPSRPGFANIITAKSYKEDGKEKGDPRFDATFILAPDSGDLTELKSLVIQMLKANIPGKKLIPRRLTQEEVDDPGVVEVSVPWRDGTREADKAKGKGKDQEFFRGMITVKAASKYAPALSGIEGGKLVEYNKPETRATLTKLFYSGAYLVPHVELHYYPAKGDKPAGVGLWLGAVCFIKHGERLGGGGGSVNAAEVFKSYAGGVSTVDPGSNELDDEIPF